MTGLCFTDFCHVPRPKKVLLMKGGGKEKKVDRISQQSIHTPNISHMSMDADIHMHTPMYMHSLGFSHANLSVHHKVKQ